jgi:hypothetical protein
MTHAAIMVARLRSDLLQEFDFPVFSLLDRLDILSQPDFENRGQVHDWRNHVPESFRRQWAELNPESRAVIYVMAEIQAVREHWE